MTEITKSGHVNAGSILKSFLCVSRKENAEDSKWKLGHRSNFVLTKSFETVSKYS